MNPFLQSALWLAGCGGIGYVLLELTKPNEDKLRAIRDTSERQAINERDRKKALFMEKLSEAASPGAKPVYMKSPTELEMDNKRQ